MTDHPLNEVERKASSKSMSIYQDDNYASLKCYKLLLSSTDARWHEKIRTKADCLRTVIEEARQGARSQ